MSPPILQVDRLSKNFRGLAAIADVSFAIEPGSITSIIGPNGAGKSTLFNLVTGYLPPSQGEIRFQGRPITGMATNRIAELGIARAFQIARPFRDLSVFDNVRIGALFGKAGARDVAATTARGMELAGIAHLAEQPASTLTVGQLRHLEVARAIATRADLLLADEPCAGLNPTETAAMIEVLRRIRDERRHRRAGRARHAVGDGSLRPAAGARRRPPDRRRPAARGREGSPR